MNTLEIIAKIIFEFGMLINAALFIPQAVKIFYRRSAIGLSLITYIGYNIIQLLMILHAYIHHDTAMLIGMLLSLITCGAVTVGILDFRPTRKQVI